MIDEQETHQISESDIDSTFELMQKLNGTSILILMYIIRNKDVIAKDIGLEFSIKKSTVSYNLKMLESNKLIERTSKMEKALAENPDELDDFDHRQKIITINEDGIRFLELLNYNLKGMF